MENKKGKVFILSDNVDTDQIFPGYAMSYPVDKFSTVVLKGSSIIDFAEKVKKGDFIVAGENFGCGSSREQAPAALKEAGVGAIIAKSFARIFRKNAINIGLVVISSQDIDRIIQDIQDIDEFELDIKNLFFKNKTQNKIYSLDKISESTLETLQAGGLIQKVRKKLIEKGESLDD